MILPSAFLLLFSLVFSALARPLPYSRASIQRRATLVTNYADFQISGGVGGNAKVEALAVFVDPFAGVDLTSVSVDEIATLQQMREDAEAAESDFNAAIEAAGGTKTPAGIDLQVGKIKNKVLKLTGFQQVLTIQEAQGKDVAAKFAIEQKKLDNNINLDIASAGGTSTPVAGSSVAPVVVAAAEEVVADEETAVEDTAAEEDVAVEDEAGVVEDTAVETPATSTGAFVEQAYADFQISGGVGGDATAEAEADFVTPFANADLSTVSAADIKSLQTMREAAEAAEFDFNAAIEAAGGTNTPASVNLQVGKIKNKVLKLTGFQQILRIQQAQGKDVAAKFAVEQKKLDNNISLDLVSAGETSTPVAEFTEAIVAASVEVVADDKTAIEQEEEAIVVEDEETAKPVPSTGSFTLRDYADFQISTGIAGNAEAEAAAVFIAPFPDLTAVTAQKLADMKTMRSAAEAAESDFNAAIDAAGGNKTPEGAALQVGKIKNKVLKLTGLSQIIRIEIAHGDGDAAKLAVEERKLANNIATDGSKAGDASTPVV